MTNLRTCIFLDLQRIEYVVLIISQRIYRIIDYQYILSNILSIYMLDLSSKQKQFPNNKNHNLHPNPDDALLQLKPLPALKSLFNHWIRSLVMQERFLVLKIYSYPIPQILRKMLNKLGLSSNESCTEMQPIKQGASFKGLTVGEVKKSLKEIEKVFIQSLVFVSDGHDFLDYICFDFSILKSPDKVFDLLTIPVSNQSAKLVQEAIKSRKTPLQIAEKLADCCSLQELAVETINFLRQEILLKFKEMYYHPEKIARDLEDEKRRKIQFNIYFKNLSQERKKQMMLLQTQSIQKLYQYFSFRQIRMEYPDLLKEFTLLTTLQKKEFCNRIFRCKIKRLTNPIIEYHQQIYHLWKSELQKNRKRKFQKKIAEQHLDESKEKQEKIHNSKAKNNKIRLQKSNSVQSNQTNVTQNKKKMKNMKKLKEFNSLKSEKVQVFVKEEDQDLEKDIKYHLVQQKSEKKRIHKKKKPKIQKFQQLPKIEKNDQLKKHKESRVQQKQISIQKQPEQQRDQKFSRLNEEMQEFADRISEEANIYHDRRIIAFQRIQFLLSYYRIQIELFGSCACGIAIQNSDIDIAVKSQVLTLFEYIPEDIRLIGALQSLQQIFATQPFISETKLISTASIPIIKLKIDTSVQFLDQNYGQIFERFNKKHNGGIIQADITIETLNHLSQSNHLGIISTQAINQWLAQIPSLSCIVIILKHFFQKKGFNQTYKGGLNTFSMIVMLVAYIYHSKMQKETNIAKVLESILSFYGHKFDEKEYGIDLLDEKSSFFFNKKLRKELNDSREKADLQIMDPKGSLRNMTRKCYLFPYIKGFFKEMLDFCFDQKVEKINEELSQKMTRRSSTKDKCNLDENESKNIFEFFLKKVISQQ